MSTVRKKLSSLAWDLWCCLSLIGIWPRFLEPKNLSVTKLALGIKNLPAELNGLRIVQFSDLHFHKKFSNQFLKKIIKNINLQKPDLIMFTGDLIYNSELVDVERLKNFFHSLNCSFGIYAILGNHDYSKYVSVNSEGDYDVLEKPSSHLAKGLSMFFKKTMKLSKKRSPALNDLILQKPAVADFLKNLGVELLHNTTIKLPVRGTFLNITGLGEYMLGDCNPDVAYKNYDPGYPGVVLTHNPDSIMSIKEYPGDLVLCGHTHGGQVNVLGLSKKFTLLENPQLKKGLWKISSAYNRKWLYINRGLGGMPFRWFSCPELLCLTLEPENAK